MSKCSKECICLRCTSKKCKDNCKRCKRKNALIGCLNFKDK